MKLANVDGRAVLLTAEDKGIDVAKASGGIFGFGSVYQNWTEFRAWAKKLTAEPDVVFTRAQLGSPSPAPRQIVAVGLNYDAHAAESGFAAPDGLPPVFAKFVSALTGPDAEVVLPPGGNVDWEVELVAVIGQTTHHLEESKAWDHIAGVTIGQDLSERVSQLAGPAPQFGLGKSFPNFAPVGPWLVTPDELADRNDLALSCAVDGETVQDGRTSELIFPVGKLISALSQTITLYPGDLVFTGTPSGVGVGRTPQRFLRAGEELVSRIEGLGEMRQTFVADPEA